jgi:hypothetical protein
VRKGEVASGGIVTLKIVSIKGNGEILPPFELEKTNEPSYIPGIAKDDILKLTHTLSCEFASITTPVVGHGINESANQPDFESV